ncbi:hypothetical protein RFI_01588, partial [Reticulomyxa filosa]
LVSSNIEAFLQQQNELEKLEKSLDRTIEEIFIYTYIICNDDDEIDARLSVGLTMEEISANANVPLFFLDQFYTSCFVSQFEQNTKCSKISFVGLSNWNNLRLSAASHLQKQKTLEILNNVIIYPFQNINKIKTNAKKYLKWQNNKVIKKLDQ